MKRTERLFDESSKISAFEATVISCSELGDGKYAVVLDKTAFFPNEGGQACDRGVVGEANVLSVDERDGIIVHTLDKKIEVGESVHGELDFAERFRKMQDHTAEHIVSGVIHRLFGYQNVGFHLGEGYMTADFDGELSTSQLDRVEMLANEAVFSCKRIRAYYPDSVELSLLEYRSKLDICENIRIVEIEDTDMCACCAPHVENTGEIGLIKIIDAIRYKGGMRLTMVAGLDALEDYKGRLSEIKRVSSAISAKQSEIGEGVERLLEDIGKLKGRISALNREIFGKKLGELTPTDGSVILFEDGGDMLSLRSFVNEGVKKCGRAFAVFVPSSDGFRYIIASNTLELKALSKEIHEALGGQGGGSSQMIQGSCTASRQEIESFLSGRL